MVDTMNELESGASTKSWLAVSMGVRWAPLYGKFGFIQVNCLILRNSIFIVKVDPTCRGSKPSMRCAMVFSRIG